MALYGLALFCIIWFNYNLVYYKLCMSNTAGFKCMTSTFFFFGEMAKS